MNQDYAIKKALKTGVRNPVLEKEILGSNPAGSDADPDLLMEYISTLIGRWPKFERLLVKYIKDYDYDASTHLAIQYADEVIKGRWRELEPHLDLENDDGDGQWEVAYCKKYRLKRRKMQMFFDNLP